ncbi:unnamed protein product [Effrenium voratum]|uniref:BTB domain-containing protein n=1 Tax=Effrenium voratum TaxID=2562239 RepID=A0AA36IYR9_9DINO|nr:unnamed protein product [Effrenium voratum]
MPDEPLRSIDVKLPLHRADQYPKSYRSPVVGLGSYCAYLYLGFDNEKSGIVANLMLIAAHPSDRDSARFVDGKVRITVKYGPDKQVREKLHRFPFQAKARTEAEKPGSSWCQTAGCMWTFNAPKEYVADGQLHCVANLWCDPSVVGYDTNKRRKLDLGKEIWQDMKFSDMTISAGEDSVDLPCHRVMLAKRSEVFDRMLSSEMSEGREQRVVIRNACTETLRCLLEYIYTEETPSGLAAQQLAELICLGNQYGLTLLAESCAERLASMLCPENVVTILQVLGKNADMSKSIQSILDQTSAKVAKDTELMRLAARVRLDESAQFRGSDGRVQIFHGLNVVQKNFPWHPSTGEFDAFASLNHEDMTNLKAWGFNVIRLGVMWPGVEPAAGQYNQTYLKVMRKLVDDLYSHGIWTIVDFHQDAFTERYCGEGVPDWLLPMLEPVERKCKGALPKIFKFLGQCKSFEDYNYSTDPETGFPNTSQCLSVGFDMYSRAPEVVSSWGNFFAYEAVQAKFRSFWQKVTEAFVGSEGVLGYDLVNEPLNGDYFRDARLFEPGHADKNLLQPMYESVGKVIRAVDPDAILMYEPAPFPDTVPAYVPGLGGVKPVGFDAGPADATHQALSYHIYSCGFAIDTCSRKGDPPSTDCHVCDDMAASAVAARDSDAKRLGGAAFLTEFGACSGTDTCVAEITRVTDLADQALHSWAYWQFKYNHDITTVAGPEEGFYGLEGQLQEKKVAALSRTFAPYIAGRPTAMRYSDTGAFRLSYVLESATRGLTTEIYLNEKMNYPSGFRVHVLNGTASSGAGRVQDSG